MFCINCGKEIDDNSKFCPECGVDTQTGQPNYQRPPRPMDPEDSGSVGWAILGFFVPVVGLILYLVWMQTKPKSGKMAGLGALVNVITGVVFVIVYVIVIMILVANDQITIYTMF